MIIMERGEERCETTTMPRISFYLLTDPLTPGKLKNTSGPERLGICFNTFISFFEWLG